MMNPKEIEAVGESYFRSTAGRWTWEYDGTRSDKPCLIVGAEGVIVGATESDADAECIVHMHNVLPDLTGGLYRAQASRQRWAQRALALREQVGDGATVDRLQEKLATTELAYWLCSRMAHDALDHTKRLSRWRVMRARILSIPDRSVEVTSARAHEGQLQIRVRTMTFTERHCHALGWKWQWMPLDLVCDGTTPARDDAGKSFGPGPSATNDDGPALTTVLAQIWRFIAWDLGRPVRMDDFAAWVARKDRYYDFLAALDAGVEAADLTSDLAREYMYARSELIHRWRVHCDTIAKSIKRSWAKQHGEVFTDELQEEVV